MADDQLNASLSELSMVLLGEQTIEEVLGTVVDLAHKTVSGADGVAVSLGEPGRLITANATDDVVRELDAVQYRVGGPCADALRHGNQVNLSLAAEGAQYPHFAMVAQERFMTAVLATPLAACGRPLGALSCYSARVARFSEEDTDLAKEFARHAAVLLTNASSFEAAGATNAQLQQALLSRDLIGQAKGILMERRQWSADQAFEELRRISQQQNRKLTAVARDLVERRALPDG